MCVYTPAATLKKVSSSLLLSSASSLITSRGSDVEIICFLSVTAVPRPQSHYAYVRSIFAFRHMYASDSLCRLSFVYDVCAV